MSYDLHITRAESWTESDQMPISSAEDIPERSSSEEIVHDPGKKLPAYMRREVVWDAIAFGGIVIVIAAVNLLELW